MQSRDTHIASGVGKPLIINDLDCDVEPLTDKDFEIHHSPEMRMFVIEQAKLAIICKYFPSHPVGCGLTSVQAVK